MTYVFRMQLSEVQSMEKINQFFKQSATAIAERSSAQIQTIIEEIKEGKIEKGQSIDQNKQREEKQDVVEEQNKSTNHEKMLEVDMIESTYIPKVNEGDDNQSVRSKKQQSLGPKSLKKQRVNQIEEEKRRILEQLQKLDNQIAQIKGECVQDPILKRKQKLMEDEQARKNAQQLIKQLKIQKKQIEERKKKEAQKSLLILQQEEAERRKQRQEQLARIKEEKRLAIEKRMEQDKRKRQQRKLMDKQSNQLIVQLKKEEELIKEKEAIPPSHLIQVQMKAKNQQKKHALDINQIQQHAKRYRAYKEMKEQIKRDRSESIKAPIPKYQKNIWNEQIEEEELKKKQEEKIKDLQKKIHLEKRLKYGELVKNIFLPKKKQSSSHQDQTQKLQKKDEISQIPSNTLPKIMNSDKGIQSSKKKFNEQPVSSTVHDYKSKVVRDPKDKNHDDQEQERLRKEREIELRRQTNDRLRKIQEKTNTRSIDVFQKSKPKYQNYLGQVKLKKQDGSSEWKKIIDDTKLSKEQKYNEMLKKAASMENKAKMKQSLRNQGDQAAVNLYIGSIQAKLALLEKF